MPREQPQFKIIRIRGDYRHRATRSAVLGTILQRKLLIDDMQRNFDYLRKRWHAVLQSLAESNWKPLLDAEGDLSTLNLQYMRNCPPFSVVTADKNRTCNRDRICPFCYARRNVMRPFVRMERVLYGPNSNSFRVAGPGSKALPVLRPDLTLIAFRLTLKNGTAWLKTKLTPKTLPDHWEAAKDYIHHNRQYERRFEPEYASSQIHLWPKSDRIELRRSGIMLVKIAPEKVVATLKRQGMQVIALKPCKKSLFEATTFAFRYPEDIFSKGTNPVMRARLLEIMSSTRLKSWCGIVKDEDGDAKDTYEE